MNYKFTLLKVESNYTAYEIVHKALNRLRCLKPLTSFKGNVMDFFEEFLPMAMFDEYCSLDSTSQGHVRRCLNQELLPFIVDTGFKLRGLKTSKSGMVVTLWIEPPEETQ